MVSQRSLRPMMAYLCKGLGVAVACTGRDDGDAVSQSIFLVQSQLLPIMAAAARACSHSLSSDRSSSASAWLTVMSMASNSSILHAAE